MEVERIGRLGSWTVDFPSRRLTASDGLRRLLDLDDAEVSSAEVLSRVAPEHRGAVLSAFERSTSGGGAPFVVECPVVCRNGERRWLIARGEVTTGPEGRALEAHGTLQDISDVRASPAVVARLAFEDPLTGLGNRVLLDDRVPVVLARAARRGWTTAVLVIDIDQFHRVNESLGFHVGDQVLMEAARRVRDAFRPYDTVVRASDTTDTVARLGGDVFVVVCEDVADEDTAAALGRRVSSVLSPPVVLDAGRADLTASVGVRLAPPGAEDIGEYLVAAGAAMRTAKARGGDRCEVFSPEMLEHQAGVASTETNELRLGLERGELRLVYQPKFALDGSGLVGVEALLRWDHPVRGTVSPEEFVPLAERSGLIAPIGAWAIDEACRQTEQWRRAPQRVPLVVSVNVSAAQLRPELVGVVQRALERHRVPASVLRLELTESVLMADVESGILVLRELARLGVSLSVDDFGTGHSSLAYLKRLPLHELKVDRSFVDGLGIDSDSTAIVAAVVAMAHALHLSVVAEGVETESQLEHLRTLGCDEAQGYLLGRPSAPDLIDELLRSGHTGRGVRGRTEARPDRVLVVDDADDVRQLARMSLAASGFEVHEASTGTAAIEAARRLQPACVLLDVELPGISGFEVCRVLREEPRTAECTIVMLTTKADASDKVEAFSVGADDYMIKPFSPRDLTSRVRAAMERSAGSATGDENGGPGRQGRPGSEW